MSRRVQTEKPEAYAWSETPPTVSGWYWWRFDEHAAPEFVTVNVTNNAMVRPADELSYSMDGPFGAKPLWGPRIPSAEDLAALLSAAGKAVDVLKEAAASPALNYSATAAANELERAVRICR